MQISAFPSQPDLFAETTSPRRVLPEGLDYQADFISGDQEAVLVGLIATLPLQEARYKGYTARRRVLSYGGSFDFDSNRLAPAEPLIEELRPLRDRLAAWVGLPPASLVHALVAEYRPGTPLGWHRDVPDFEQIIGLSLGTHAILRLRAYPPDQPKREDVVRLTVAPRSVYRMRGPSRWNWQHSIAPTPGLRWSITFRTAAQRSAGQRRAGGAG